MIPLFGVGPLALLGDVDPSRVAGGADSHVGAAAGGSSLSSGLYAVVLINVVTAWVGLLVYRYVIAGQATLGKEEIELLRRYSSLPSSHGYTPQNAGVPRPPPLRWTGWRGFFCGDDSRLSRDAQVYLLFQRASIAVCVLCALASGLLLVPVYWFANDPRAAAVAAGAAGAAGVDAVRPRPPLLSLLKSDRGIFDRMTAHNLPEKSPAQLLQLPAAAVAALTVIMIYTLIQAAAGEEKTAEEWLRRPAQSSLVIASPGPPAAPSWTVFIRGLPRDIRSSEELQRLLEAIRPGEIESVELVCKGRMSEARLQRALYALRNRKKYFEECSDARGVSRKFEQWHCFGFAGRPKTREELVKDLQVEIEALEKDVESRTQTPVRGFLGCAFVTVRTADAAEALLYEFPIKRHHPLARSHGHLHDHWWQTFRLSNLCDGLTRFARHVWPVRRSREHLGAGNGLIGARSRESSKSSVELGENGTDRFGGWQPRDAAGEAGISKEAASLRLCSMKAERAPKTGDIIWRNVGMSFYERTLREIFIQCLVFAILILFTSPVAMLTALKLVFSELALLGDPHLLGAGVASNGTVANGGESLGPELLGLGLYGNYTDDAARSLSEALMSFLPRKLSSSSFTRSILLAYMPVLLLSGIFAVVPSLLRLACGMEGYATHSATEISVFRKTVFYYIMNSVVLPALALNTASEFIQMIYSKSGGGLKVYDALPILERLFSGDVAFFLCCYLVQLALSGSVFWLMRIPSNMSIMVRRGLAFTPLEVAEAKCTDIFDFPRQYAYSITALSMCILFGFVAPPLWGFALFYLVCKHAVDEYNIRYVHPRSHIDGRLPRLAMSVLLTLTAVSQLSLGVVFYLKRWMKAALFMGALAVSTLFACFWLGPRAGNRVLRLSSSLRAKVQAMVFEAASRAVGARSTTERLRMAGSSSSSLSEVGPQETDSLLEEADEMDKLLLGMPYGDAEELEEELEGGALRTEAGDERRDVEMGAAQQGENAAPGLRYGAVPT